MSVSHYWQSDGYIFWGKISKPTKKLLYEKAKYKKKKTTKHKTPQKPKKTPNKQPNNQKNQPTSQPNKTLPKPLKLYLCALRI